MQFVTGAYVAIVLFLNFVLGFGFFESFFYAFPVGIGLVIVAAVVGIPILLKRNREAAEAEERLRQQLAVQATTVVASHLPALLRKRRISIVADDYGVTDTGKWDKELDYFFDRVLAPEIAFPADDGSGERRSWLLATVVAPQIDAAAAKAKATFFEAFDPSMSPLEYEGFCAERLRQAGWKSTTTKGSGDQGADIVASIGNTSIVIQCKRYAKPVGNSSVQQVAAARDHYGASHAIVVATNGYTRSARELAATTGVLLLDHDDLNSDLAAKLENVTV